MTEALRRANEILSREKAEIRADFVAQLDVASRQAVEMQAEIERLQKDWIALYGVERMRWAAVQQMTAEIERLRAGWEAEGLKRLQAEVEIERLRAFIQGCSACKEEWEKSALEGK